MRTKEDLKNTMNTEFAKTLPQIDSSSTSDFLTAAGEMMRSVDEDINKKNKTKSKNKINKMKTPIGKIFSIGKRNSSGNVNVKITEQQLTLLLREFTEIMVMCTPWSKCMDDPKGKNPETKWFIGRLEYNEDINKWMPYSQDSNTYKTREEANDAYLDGLYSTEPIIEGRTLKKEKIKGGLSDNKTLEDIAKKHDKKGYYHKDNMISSLKKQLNKGIKVEMEHTKDKTIAKEIAMDHLYEDPNYYDKLEKIENKEATGSGSSGGFVGPTGFDPKSTFVKKSFKETPKKVESNEATGVSSSGSYVTPAAWAKSTNKKDWRGKSKTQIPGGKFVQVKKKCKTFPYCNQGDIKALKLTNENDVKKDIISEDLIKEILSSHNKNNK